jgi:hypothetical protein
MATQTSQLYFSGSNGSIWDNYKTGSNLIGTGAGVQTATSPLLSNATSASLNYDISIETSLVAGAMCIALKSIDLVFPDGKTVNVYTIFYGGCDFPLNCAASGSASGTVDLTSYLSAYAGQDVTIKVTACGYPGNSGITWNLTSFITETEPITPASVDVVVSSSSGFLSGAIVTMNDTTQSVTYQSTTNSKGQASFAKLNVGDDIAMTVTYTGYTTITETLSIEHKSSTISAIMSEPITGTILGAIEASGKYILILVGVTLGGAAIYEVAKHRSPKPLYRPVRNRTE